MKTLLAATLALLTAVAAAQTAAQTIEQGGIGLRYSSAADGAVARLAFSDSATGTALSGMRPAAWMQLRRSAAELETPCEDRAKQFVAGSLGSRSDIDLNAYRLVTLNQDDTIAFINPQVRIRGSRLEAIVSLPSRGHDWAYSDASRLLAVTLRSSGQLAVVDAVARKLLGVVELGANSEPTRLVLEPGGTRAWVGLDGADAIALVDLASRRELARVGVGRGPHTLAAVPGQPWLVAAHAGASQASLIDVRQARRLGHVAVAEAPIAVAYSGAAQRAVVLSGRGGELALLALGNDGPRIDGRAVALEAGALSLALVGDGRHVLVGNVVRHDLSLIDLARRQVRARADVPPWPDQIVATRAFAYVRSQTSNRVAMFGIDAMQAGQLTAVEVPIGRAAPSDLVEALNVAPLMAAAPEGNGIYAGVAADGQLYRYTEGLMVPSGSLGNYRRAARGLLVIDESLKEQAAGRFEAPLRPPRSGTYDVVVRNASPSFTACFSVTLQAPPSTLAEEAAPPKPRLLAWRQSGNRVELDIALHDAGGLALAADGDMQALLLAPGAAWQRRGEILASRPMNTSSSRQGGLVSLAEPERPESAAATHWTVVLHVPEGSDVAQAELLLQSSRHGLAFTRGRVGKLADLGPPRAPGAADRAR